MAEPTTTATWKTRYAAWKVEGAELASSARRPTQFGVEGSKAVRDNRVFLGSEIQRLLKHLAARERDIQIAQDGMG